MVRVGRDEGGKKNIRTFWRMDAIETSEPRFITRKARTSFRFGSEHICRAGEAGALLRGAFCFARSGSASKHSALMLRAVHGLAIYVQLCGKERNQRVATVFFGGGNAGRCGNLDIQGNWGRRLNVERQSATNVGRAHVEERRPPRLLKPAQDSRGRLAWGPEERTLFRPHFLPPSRTPPACMLQARATVTEADARAACGYV
jgi:hypothetical protein